MINIEEQKKTLLQEESVLLEELKNLGVRDSITGDWDATPIPARAEDTTDENDAADAAEEFETRSATLNVLEIRLRDVQDALKKIDLGTYGICEKTGEPIEEDRLIANPSARTKKSVMN
jgi:RNA polymerase-binding transcription factor DksA